MSVLDKIAQAIQATPPNGGPPGYYTTDYKAQARAAVQVLIDNAEEVAFAYEDDYFRAALSNLLEVA